MLIWRHVCSSYAWIYSNIYPAKQLTANQDHDQSCILLSISLVSCLYPILASNRLSRCGILHSHHLIWIGLLIGCNWFLLFLLLVVVSSPLCLMIKAILCLFLGFLGFGKRLSCWCLLFVYRFVVGSCLFRWSFGL